MARWLALALLLVLAAGFTYEELGRRADARRLPRVGQPIDIGGRTLNVSAIGQGVPAVVLVPGASTPGIAWTAIQNGRRVRLRYLGAAKNDAWLHNRCAAINLRTLLRHGLTRRDGAWVLA